jgi:hypothetical protein
MGLIGDDEAAVVLIVAELDELQSQEDDSIEDDMLEL